MKAKDTKQFYRTRSRRVLPNLAELKRPATDHEARLVERKSWIRICQDQERRIQALERQVQKLKEKQVLTAEGYAMALHTNDALVQLVGRLIADREGKKV